MRSSPPGSRYRGGAVHSVPETDDIIVLCLEGEFDLRDAPTLDEEIDRALEGGKNLILDLSPATFIDSSVIQVLLRAATASTDGRTVVLQLGSVAIVDRALEIVGIERVLPRAATRSDAVRIIHARSAIEQSDTT